MNLFVQIKFKIDSTAKWIVNFFVPDNLSAFGNYHHYPLAPGGHKIEPTSSMVDN